MAHRIPDWDLNWQAVYRYAKPVFLPRGTVISMRYLYDNSDKNPRNPFHPPRPVSAGNQATDEMGHLWLQVLPTGEKDERMILQEALMQHRLEKYPGDFSALFNLGALHLARKDAAAMLPLLQDAVRAQPEQPVALNTLGAAFESLGRNEEAVVQFRQALRVQPSYSNARYNLANSLADLGDLDAAIAEFKTLLAGNPDDQNARQHLEIALEERGTDHVRTGNWQAAESCFRELAELDPASSQTHDQLGLVLAKRGNAAEALKEFRRALAADPNDQTAQKNIEWLMRNGRTDQ